LGYYLNTISLLKIHKRIFYVLGLISLTCTIYGTYMLSKQQGVASQALLEYLFPNTIILSIAVFILFLSLTIEVSEKWCKVLSKLSRLSFGVYLVHELVHVFLRKVINIPVSTFFPILSIPVFAMIILVISYCIVCFIDKIPFVRKYII
jgi:surface polysaccharide O-acyltransferase-like enzyme